MPFRSESQRKWMFSKHPEMAKRWAAHTPKNADLPEHVKQSAFFDELQEIAKQSGLGMDLRMNGPGNIKRPPFSTEGSKSLAFKRFNASQNAFKSRQPPEPNIRAVVTKI